VDAGGFERCLTLRQHSEAVQLDFEKGTRLGVSGPPSFSSSERIIAGNQPIEVFASLIDQE